MASALPRSRPGLPPGPPLPAGVQTLLFWRSPFRLLQMCRKRYGSRFTLRAAGMAPLVFLSDAQEVKALLGAPPEVLRPGEGGASIMPIVGPRSFMLLDGEEHLAGRRAILPPFRDAAVNGHAEMVARIVRREVSGWPRETPFALHPRLRSMTLQIALRTIFGDHHDAARLALLHERLLAMLSITAGPLLALPMLRRGPGSAIWQRFLKRRAEVDQLIHAFIDERRQRGRGCGAPKGAVGSGGGAQDGAPDILAKLMAAPNADGTPQSAGQLRDNIMSLILAGHETTASEMAWAFQLLAHHPAVQNRLRNEIDIDSGDEYLTATIHETLRHRPVFLFTIPRAVASAVEIGGWTYRPPAQLLGCIYLMHHDSARYPRPHEFRPERFLCPHSDTSAPAPARGPDWLPWGGGRKRCPGLHMATLELRTVLRTVLREVSVQPAGSTIERPLWRSVVVTPHAGSRVILRNRRST